YDICKAFIKEKHLKLSNCRFEKRIVNGEIILLIKVASINTETIEEMFMETKIKLEKGHYSSILDIVCANLRKAGEYAVNESQQQMLRNFADYFETGGYLEYAQAIKLWSNEDNPKIQTSFVFKENTRNGSESMGRNYIYSNVINAWPESMRLIKNEDKGVLTEFNTRILEVSTGLHELLGHGSGKIFERKTDGTFNFDTENTVDILTGGKVTSWYEPDQSYKSVFGDLATPFEECRAFAVSVVLCCDK
ncbi:hypothetical protein PRIPAC_93031, partial [Pristionchus pacificus]